MSFFERFKNKISGIDQVVEERRARAEALERNARLKKRPNALQRERENFQFVEPLADDVAELFERINADYLEGQGVVTTSAPEHYSGKTITSYVPGPGDRAGGMMSSTTPSGIEQVITFEISHKIANFKLQGRLKTEEGSRSPTYKFNLETGAQPGIKASHLLFLYVTNESTRISTDREGLREFPSVRRGKEANIEDIPKILEYFTCQFVYLKLVRAKDIGYYFQESKRLRSEDEAFLRSFRSSD